MSTNKSFVKTITTTLDLIGKEVKTSQVYENLSQLSGYKNWDAFSATGKDFTDEAKVQVHNQVLNQVQKLDDKNWRKHLASFLLNTKNTESLKALTSTISEHGKLTSSDKEQQDLINSLIQAKLPFVDLREAVKELVMAPVLASLMMKNQELMNTLNKPQNSALSEELGKEELAINEPIVGKPISEDGLLFLVDDYLKRPENRDKFNPEQLKDLEDKSEAIKKKRLEN